MTKSARAVLAFLTALIIFARPVHAVDCGALPPAASVTLDSVEVFQFGTFGGSDCWGWEGPDGTDYAIMGTAAGVTFVNATTLELIQTVPGPVSGCSTIRWRDMVSFGHYCYCVSECTGTNEGLMIIDMQYLPDSVHLANVYQHSGDRTSHNMIIDTARAYAYIVEADYSGFRVVNLADPVNPVDVIDVQTDNIHDVYARNDTVWVAEGSLGTYSIWDLSNKLNPQLLTRFGPQSAGYAHNIWPTRDGRHCVTTEETPQQTIKVWNVANFDNVQLASEFLAPSELAHNAHLIGDYVVMSHYESGVRIVDLSVPECPREVGYFDTYTAGESPSYEGAWGAFPFTNSGKIYGSNVDGRLFILQSDLQVLDFNSGPVVGEPPLNVKFDDASYAPITAWNWDFGDGNSDSGPSVEHTYTAPGAYTVDMTVTIGGSPTVVSRPGAVAVVSDTVKARDTSFQADQTAIWDLYMTNNVPIDEILLPIKMTNVPSVMYLDSISFTGTRLEYFEKKQTLVNNSFNGQIVIRRVADNGGGSPPLAPGSGIIARAYVRTRDTAVPGDTVFFGVEPLVQFDLECVTYGVSFKPQFSGATMSIAVCDCDSHGDLVEDGAFDVLDMNALIGYIFFNAEPTQDANCPHVDRGDVNCDGVDDAVDLNYLIQTIFFNGPVPCDPCACTSYPAVCP